MNAAALTAELQQLTAGLLFLSESESPFTVLAVPGADCHDPAAVASAAGLPAGTELKPDDAAAFFGRIAQQADPADPAMQEYTKRMTALYEFFKTQVTEPVLYRRGEVEVTLLLCGNDAEGTLHLLQTTSVET